jgi:hypothetical protein
MRFEPTNTYQDYSLFFDVIPCSLVEEADGGENTFLWQVG